MTITNSYTGHASNYTQGMGHLVDPLGLGQSRSLGVGQRSLLGVGQSRSLGVRQSRSLGMGQSRLLGVGQSRSLGVGQSHSRISVPPSERTDSDDAQLLFRNSGRTMHNQVLAQVRFYYNDAQPPDVAPNICANLWTHIC
ncbi:Type IV secretion protein Rhs [Operophtera brumata]|uniref:Type IV secretion protein Rhs n=1 Tax=Operophtera brumata TaxID=104452 RepID=A0A0L7L0L5_OPEBR|nr:Type IV secretion protein Rhs [Operophtera brumata]